jgi:hypothetical protein
MRAKLRAQGAFLKACTFNDFRCFFLQSTSGISTDFFYKKNTVLRSLQSLAHIVSSHAFQASCTLTETLSSAPAAGS